MAHIQFRVRPATVTADNFSDMRPSILIDLRSLGVASSDILILKQETVYPRPHPADFEHDLVRVPNTYDDTNFASPSNKTSSVAEHRSSVKYLGSLAEFTGRVDVFIS